MDVALHANNDDGDHLEYAVFVRRIGTPEARTIEQLERKKDRVREDLLAFRRENPAPPDDASDEAKATYRKRIEVFTTRTGDLNRNIAAEARFVSSFTEWLPAPNTATTLYYNRLVPLRIYQGDRLAIWVNEVDPLFSETIGRQVLELTAERLALGKRGLTLRDGWVEALEIQFREVQQ